MIDLIKKKRKFNKEKEQIKICGSRTMSRKGQKFRTEMPEVRNLLRGFFFFCKEFKVEIH